MKEILAKKLVDPVTLSEIIQTHKCNGKAVAFTNGCFDLIHTGHTRYLMEARMAADYLVVALNSDQSVRRLKGESRPIIPLEERMEILAGFYFVDYVISFDEPDPYNLIKQLRPTILIKGGDWPIDKIIGRDLVEADGGKVFTIPEIKGHSTTNIITKIIKLHTGE